ncbi:DUF1028 domain-containing protein [Halohasta litorea]|uniref:DUF1028 domain-containing protein n=1 Tax=Halohasta litorea TaxID=869891 RepID=A0ABD6DAR4_9EURY|nr:DUF1028 domain-containing protein [Halohasta litorea]
MTLSLCVREPYQDGDDTRHYRFGLAVTTRLPGVGALCPFVSENGAVAVQSHTSDWLGERTLSYLADGLAIDDAVEALLSADDNRRNRQVHGVDADGSVVFTGRECVGEAGHRDTGQFTVAGNLLEDEHVLDATAAAYESDAFGDAPLAERLVDALSAGVEAGGDKRESLSVGSAALKVVTTEKTAYRRFYNDLRVDASETPVAELRTTYEAALLGYEQSLDEYADPEDIESLRPE